jgi:hypothetical protein
MPPKLDLSPLDVPPLKYDSVEEAKQAEVRYVAQKRAREVGGGLEPMASIRRPDSPAVLTHSVLSSDCYNTGCIYGGVVMKLMDTGCVVYV